MKRGKIAALFSFVVFSVGLLGCGSSELNVPSNHGSTATITVLPRSAPTGSSDLTLTIIGSNFLGAPHEYSQVVWSVSGTNTLLATTFVTTTKLTALVPSALLANSIAAQVFVQTGDPMGDIPLSKSIAVTFEVTAPSPGVPLIISVSPQSAVAGSSDLTITVMGANFIDGAPHKHNVVVWTVGGKPTFLATTFVSGSELTAVIPAALLSAPVTAQLDVEIWDSMGDVPERISNSTAFVVNSATSASIKTLFHTSELRRANFSENAIGSYGRYLLV
jgi:hypothetical protein